MGATARSMISTYLPPLTNILRDQDAANFSLLNLFYKGRAQLSISQVFAPGNSHPLLSIGRRGRDIGVRGRHGGKFGRQSYEQGSHPQHRGSPRSWLKELPHAGEDDGEVAGADARLGILGAEFG